MRAETIDGFERMTVLGVSNKLGITETDHKKSKDLSKYLAIEPQDFAYNPYRINVGSIGLTPEATSGLVSPAYVVFTTTDKLLPELLLDFLKSKDGLFQIKKYARGTVRKALRYEDLCEIEMPIPSISKQKDILKRKRIIEKEVCELNSEYAYQIELIKKFRQQILQDAIEGKLTFRWREENSTISSAKELLESIISKKQRLIASKKIKNPKPLPQIIEEEKVFDLPEKWQWCKLGELYEIVRGSSPRPKGDPRFWCKERTAYHWITIADFTPYGHGDTLVDTKGFLTAEGAKRSRQVKENDLLIACSGVGSVGRSIKSGIEGYIYDGLLAVRNIEDDIIRDYLAIFLKFKEAQIYSIATGANWLNINIELLSNYVLALPPKEEIKVIINKVTELLSICDHLEEQIHKNQQYSDQLRQIAIREAFAHSEHEVQNVNNVVELKQSKNKQADYYKRTLLAAEIVDQLHKEPTFGHLKLQKLVYLCQRTQDMELPTNFLQQAAGPYDPQMARSLDKQLKEKQWYKYNSSARLKYQPLDNAGDHKGDFQKYFDSDISGIQKLITLFKTTKSNEIEAVATLYACWEGIIQSGTVFSKATLIEKFFEWSEEKRKFSERQVNEVIEWMEKQGIYPQS